MEELARKSFPMHEQFAKTLGRDYGFRKLDTFAVEVSEKEGSSGSTWMDGKITSKPRKIGRR